MPRRQDRSAAVDTEHPDIGQRNGAAREVRRAQGPRPREPLVGCRSRRPARTSDSVSAWPIRGTSRPRSVATARPRCTPACWMITSASASNVALTRGWRRAADHQGVRRQDRRRPLQIRGAWSRNRSSSRSDSLTSTSSHSVTCGAVKAEATIAWAMDRMTPRTGMICSAPGGVSSVRRRPFHVGTGDHPAGAGGVDRGQVDRRGPWPGGAPGVWSGAAGLLGGAAVPRWTGPPRSRRAAPVWPPRPGGPASGVGRRRRTLAVSWLRRSRRGRASRLSLDTDQVATDRPRPHRPGRAVRRRFPRRGWAVPPAPWRSRSRTGSG